MGNDRYSKRELSDVFNKRLGLKHVEFLGPIYKKRNSDISLEDLPVYRYMHYPHVKDMFTSENPALFFVSPEKWDDPMEKRFAQGNYKKAKNFTKKSLACMCVTVNAADNEAAAWVMYDKDHENDLVRLTYRFGTLLKILDDYVAGKDAKVYVSGVNYVPIEEIESPKTADAEIFSDTDFLKLMLLKRKSFMFEGEIRIMIYGRDVSLDDKMALQVPLKDIKSLVRSIRLSPDDSKRAMSKEIVQSDVRARVKVTQSRLNACAHKFTLKNKEKK